MPQTIQTRLAIGLIQGVALYFLWQAAEAKTWPATAPLLFMPLALVALFVPLVLAADVGSLRRRTLLSWIAAASVLCACLAWYESFRNSSPAPMDPRGEFFQAFVTLFFWAGLTLFILNALVVSADKDQRPIADFPTYFDVAWKQGVQLALVGCFVGVFWGLLWLGAALFSLIKIEAFREVIAKPWFAIPAVTLAASYAIHVTDVRTGLIRDTRTLVLTLLSWLLPVMAGIAAAFVASLPFTGLEALFSTRYATTILLVAVAALVLLMNAAYQDGQDIDARLSLPIRLALHAAALITVPLVSIATYALLLRVEQYGWTPRRIIVLACIIIAGSHAIGYAIAASRRHFALRVLEKTNVFSAFVTVAIIIALRSPLADPDRIGVADQIARLKDGRTTPEKFDFRFLARGAGGHGKTALEELTKGGDYPNAGVIAGKAKAALAGRPTSPQFAAASPDSRRTNITVVHPAGQALPDSLLRQEWTEKPYSVPRCLTFAARCEAVLVDLDADGAVEVVLWQVPGTGGTVLKQTDGWVIFGTLFGADCAGVKEALRAGSFELGQPQTREIRAAGQRINVITPCLPNRP